VGETETETTGLSGGRNQLRFSNGFSAAGVGAVGDGGATSGAVGGAASGAVGGGAGSSGGWFSQRKEGVRPY